jgi:hypothetical protein
MRGPTDYSRATLPPEAHVAQWSSGFPNRVPWFDSGRGHCRALASEAAFGHFKVEPKPANLAFVYQPSTTATRPDIYASRSSVGPPAGACADHLPYKEEVGDSIPSPPIEKRPWEQGLFSSPHVWESRHKVSDGRPLGRGPALLATTSSVLGPH